VDAEHARQPVALPPQDLVGTTSTLIGSGPALVAGQWTHVAATYDGAQMRLYQNGVLTGSLAKTGTIATNSSVAAWIGDNPTLGKSFDGLIDEVRIWSRVLNATEIAAEMQRPSYTDFVENPTLEMSHQEILTGLTALTQYHFMISAEDAGGAPAARPTRPSARATWPMPPSCPTTSTPARSDRGRSRRRSATRPTPSRGRARGTRGCASRFRQAYRTTRGTSFDAPRITQPAQDTDFQIETRFDSTFAQGVQEQGIVIETATGQWPGSISSTTARRCARSPR